MARLLNRKITIAAVAIAAVIGVMLIAPMSFAAMSSNGSITANVSGPNTHEKSLSALGKAAEKYIVPGGEAAQGLSVSRANLGMALAAGAPPMQRGGPLVGEQMHGRHGSFANVTIDAARAKAVVEASIPNYKVGTITSAGTSWIVPIEDGKGVVTRMALSKVSASTADQAKTTIEDSLKRGWKTGEPRLTRVIYNVPLIDSSGVAITYARVDGRNGEIIRGPTTIPSITSDQAKTIVSAAIKQFTVGDVRDRGSVWMVSIKYKDKVLMTIPLGKLNTPTSEDATKVVQDSLAKGWNVGSPTLARLIYSVPIIVENNTIGIIHVNGGTGEIITGPPILRR